jgi:hypothetical protein
VRALIVLAATTLAGCIDAGVFRCQSDAACRSAQGAGTCEPAGYCSYSDSMCMPTPRRYGELAPAGLAGQCVSAANGAACGGPGVLTDNFDDGVVPGQGWGGAFSNGMANYTETGGHLVITTPSNQLQNDYAGYLSDLSYDLHNDAVFVEVLQVPDPSGNADTYLRASADGGNDLTIIEEHGTLSFHQSINGTITSVTPSIPYDPVQHRWWRIRETGGLSFWETSPDAMTWTVRAQENDPFDVSAMYLQLIAGTYLKEPLTGTSVFDNFNGGAAPTQSWCPLAKLTDSFDVAYPQGMFRWESLIDVDPGCQTITAGGQAVFTPPIGQPGYCTFTSTSKWDLRNSYAAIHVVQMLNTAVDAVAFMQVRLSSADNLEIGEDLGLLHFGHHVGGVYSTVVNDIPYDPVQHAWWRFREAAGIVYWETSPDGKNWTIQGQQSDPFDLSAVFVRFGAGQDTGISNPGTVKFDDFNRLP